MDLVLVASTSKTATLAGGLSDQLIDNVKDKDNAKDNAKDKDKDKDKDKGEGCSNLEDSSVSQVLLFFMT